MPRKKESKRTSNLAFLAILVPSVINPERVISYAMQNRRSNPAYPAILIPEAINPGRAISYARQNRVPTYQLPCVPGDTDS